MLAFQLISVSPVLMARAKRIYIFIVKVNKLFSFWSSRCFLIEIENMFSVFLSSYRNTRESLGEREMLWDSATLRNIEQYSAAKRTTKFSSFFLPTGFFFSSTIVLLHISPGK